MLEQALRPSHFRTEAAPFPLGEEGFAVQRRELLPREEETKSDAYDRGRVIVVNVGIEEVDGNRVETVLAYDSARIKAISFNADPNSLSKTLDAFRNNGWNTVNVRERVIIYRQRHPFEQVS